jgi:flagellar protein FlbT
MPLKLDLKVGEKMIVNGAVLENVGQNAKLLVRNMAAVLREKEILTQDDAVTPASRVYFALQCAYIFPQSRAGHLKHVDQFLGDYQDACPSAADIVETIRGHVADGEYYRGMKAARKLIAHELETLSEFRSEMDKLDEIADGHDEDDDAFDDGDAGVDDDDPLTPNAADAP